MIDAHRYLSSHLRPEETVTPRKSGIGKDFQRAMSEVAPDDLPPRFQPNPRNWYAMLSTNEWADNTFRVEDKGNPVDGYIIGVGFGNIFRMLDLLPTSNSLPKAVLATDVMPEVVLAGRIGKKKLAQAQDTDAFLQAVRSTTTSDIDAAIKEEENPTVAQRLGDARGYVQQTFQSGEFPIGQGWFLNHYMIDILDRNFLRMQQLAREENIGVTLMGITNPHFLTGVRQLDGYGSSRNVVYVSNIIDHITQRGEDPSQFEALRLLEALETQRRSVCVDTTEQERKYALRTRGLPPTYSKGDFTRLYGRSRF